MNSQNSIIKPIHIRILSIFIILIVSMYLIKRKSHNFIYSYSFLNILFFVEERFNKCVYHQTHQT